MLRAQKGEMTMLEIQGVSLEIEGDHSEAQLVHEAAIGRIESEQLIKLMSMGLTEKEAEDTILKGFLK